MITPTFTMAKLYEKQGEFTHALGVYLLLAETDKQAKKKVKELTKKLFEKPDLQYNPLISSIFDKQQLQKIQLLPAKEYKKLKLEETDTDLPAEETEIKPKTDTAEEKNIEELDLQLDDGINLADFKKLSTPEPKPAKVTPPPVQNKPQIKIAETKIAPPKRKNFEEMSLAEILKIGAENLDPQTKLTQITLGELKKLLGL